MAKTAKKPSAGPAATAGPGRDLDQKYRPRTLDAVVGQGAALAAICKWGTNVPRCVLFHGPAGCGKTTQARIVAANILGIRGRDLAEVNCGMVESPIAMVRGIDAAMRMAPMLGDRLGWILDEAQTLSRQKGAQEALLKVLEDCPDHVHFFLCTTDPKRLLEAVRTRCTDVPVKALAPADAERLVRGIAAAEGIALDDEVVDGIVACAGGSARVAVKTLEKVAGLPPDEALAALGGGYGENSEAFALARALIYDRQRAWPNVAAVLLKLDDEDPEGLRQMLLACARKQLLQGREAKWAHRVIICLEKPLYDRASGRALLAAYLFDAFHGG